MTRAEVAATTELEGRIVNLALVGGRRYDDCQLVSVPRRHAKTFWVFISRRGRLRARRPRVGDLGERPNDPDRQVAALGSATSGRRATPPAPPNANSLDGAVDGSQRRQVHGPDLNWNFTDSSCGFDEHRRASRSEWQHDGSLPAPGWFTRNVFNRFVAFVTRHGVSVMGSRVLRQGPFERRVADHAGQPSGTRRSAVPGVTARRGPMGSQLAGRGCW